MSNVVGPGEAARRLGVSTRTIQRWLREGRLPAVRVGSHIKVDADALPNPGSDKPAERQIKRLLIANRGELVVRIARTCRQLGVTSLALVPEDQARAWWVSATDEIVPLSGSYLDAGAVLRAALVARADAIHPGYGFLAEHADFAEAVVAAGMTWVGPYAVAMRALGDKAAARRLAASVGVPTLPGYDGADQADARFVKEARRIGYPVLVKPSAGGGGKGMHIVESARDMRETLARARREAAAAFGEERMILEKYLPRPRHVEIQLLRDAHGNAVHLGERECSLQRRHQKVVEEAPSPAVGARLRRRLGEATLRLAAEAGYTGAGTAEFLVDRDAFYFLEVNARLQVEHPVTELVTGRDLVADQLRIAEGRPLDVRQADISLEGHAIEARLYAEDPWHDFLPATGEVMRLRLPGTDEGIRVDAGIGEGDVVGTRYDPLLAKVIAHGGTRTEALDRLIDALDRTSVVGVTTNRGFLRWLLSQPKVRQGGLFTTQIDESWQPPRELPDEAWTEAVAALALMPPSEADTRLGFRLNAPSRMRIRLDGEARSVELPGRTATVAWAPAGDSGEGRRSAVIDFCGLALRASLAPPPSVDDAMRASSHTGSAAARIEAPMPGTVISVRVEAGDDVAAGQVLVVLEAMKMENTVSAPAAGRVERVLVEIGHQVQRGQVLVELS